MATLNTKQFIQQIFIDELGVIVNTNPYISFMVMAVGIEFLGKCLNKSEQWNTKGGSRTDFEHAIKSIPVLQKYSQYLEDYDLYHSFRCGLLHAAVPKYEITLSSKDELSHLVENGNRLNLKAEDMYFDFKEACHFVINKEYGNDNKFEKFILSVPPFSKDAFNKQFIVPPASGSPD